MTARDEIWSVALDVAMGDGFRFTARNIKSRLEDTDPSKKTVQRTLNEMTSYGWLSHRDGSQYYRAGTKLP